jgi:hypothetical protein
MMAHILSWRCGTVAVESRKAEGALVLATGPRKRLQDALEVCARHAYDGKTLLVPGVPEAKDDQAAIKATLVFQTFLNVRLAPKARPAQ